MNRHPGLRRGKVLLDIAHAGKPVGVNLASHVVYYHTIAGVGDSGGRKR